MKACWAGAGVILIAGLAWPSGSFAVNHNALPRWSLRLAETLCQNAMPDQAGLEQAFAHTNTPAGQIILERKSARFLSAHIRFSNGGVAGISIRFPASARAQVRLQYRSNAPDKNDLFVQTGPGCKATRARSLSKHKDGRPDKLLIFSDKFDRPIIREALNPPVPKAKDPGGVAIALIDTGLNYTLPQFRNRLARDKQGEILGYDFAEDDKRPYDFDPQRSALFPRHHGTAVASIIVREAPKARLIPMRYPGRNFAKFSKLVNTIAAGPARIVSMPLGGHKRTDWLPFAKAAHLHPEILFIVSAGNNGRDIGEDHIFPASFKHDNLLVVTSSDQFGRIASDANWSSKHIDISTPGERINVIDHRGVKTKASGTSYAVPRIAALAARIKAKHPGWTAKQIKQNILSYAAQFGRGANRRTRHGWIANPAIVDQP